MPILKTSLFWTTATTVETQLYQKKPGQEEEEGGDFTFHGLEEVAGGSLNHTRHLLPTKPTNLVETWHERKKEDVWSRPGRRIKDGEILPFSANLGSIWY